MEFYLDNTIKEIGVLFYKDYDSTAKFIYDSQSLFLINELTQYYSWVYRGSFKTMISHLIASNILSSYAEASIQIVNTRSLLVAIFLSFSNIKVINYVKDERCMGVFDLIKLNDDFFLCSKTRLQFYKATETKNLIDPFL